MPRKPKKAEKRTISVVVTGKAIPVVMHPPTGSFKTWYSYWTGATFKRSTGQTEFADAVKAAEAMVRGTGRKATVADATLSDEEFEAVQRMHFERKTDAKARTRSAKTLEECLDSIAAFKSITNLDRIADATPDDCAKFQREALQRPRNWRRQHPKSKKTDERLSPNTVLKWSRMLQASFDRVNRNAGKKCVRGVVDETKLVTANPWTQFPWIEGTERPIRQFDASELLSFLAYLETNWPGVPVAALATKVLLWSCCRKLEVAGLRWDALRIVSNEVHFEIIGKWGVERWFRLPQSLYDQLLAARVNDPFVFGAYSEQIRRVHLNNAGCMKKIRDQFDPRNFGRWLYERIKDWAASHGKDDVYVHVFRKTGLQLVHDGEEEASQKVANDAGVSEAILLGHYVKPKLWRRSNRTYRRLLASLPPEVSSAYGYIEDDRARLARQLDAAKDVGNWKLVAELAAQIGRVDQG